MVHGALELPRVTPGDVAVITGPGAIGLLTLQVPPGSYWVFIPPLPPDAPDPARRVGVTALPDGTPSLEWWTVADVTAGAAVGATLTLDVPPAN